MAGYTLEPTITQRVRRFMMDRGLRVRPWTGLDETYRALHRLLAQKKDEPEFWAPLAALLKDVVAAATTADEKNRLPAPHAELLRAWDIDRLVADLRAAMPEAGTGFGAAALLRFTSSLCAPALGGFLLLGLATACDHVHGSSDGTQDASADTDADTDADAEADSDTDSDADTDTDTESETDSWPEGCDLATDSTLFAAIDTSSLDGSEKTHLCDCFETLNESWSTGLTELFEAGTAEQIAYALHQMLQCCQTPDTLDTDYADVSDAFMAGELCSVPVYMAVSFPKK